jgi:hypothetical protein
MHGFWYLHYCIGRIYLADIDCAESTVMRVCFLHAVWYPVVGKMTTFDLWPLPLGGGAWGAGTNMWYPETPASYESLPAPLATQILTLLIHTSGGRGRGGALILDRCRAFDLFASVDAHLCWYHSLSIILMVRAWSEPTAKVLFLLIYCFILHILGHQQTPWGPYRIVIGTGEAFFCSYAMSISMCSHRRVSQRMYAILLLLN